MPFLRFVAAAAVIVTMGSVATGCATSSAIVVLDKEVRERWESQPVGQSVRLTTRPSAGRSGEPREIVGEVRRERLVREYWVKATDGQWHRIGKSGWEGAVVGQSLQVQPALPERVTRPTSEFPCVGPDGHWKC